MNLGLSLVKVPKIPGRGQRHGVVSVPLTVKACLHLVPLAYLEKGTNLSLADTDTEEKTTS